MPRIDLADLAEQSFGTSLEQLDDRRIYKLLVKLVQERSAACPLNNGKKKLYYISAEFLIGKLLINNMIDLGIYEVVEEDMALCEFVSTSKTPVQKILRNGLNLMMQEVG